MLHVEMASHDVAGWNPARPLGMPGRQPPVNFHATHVRLPLLRGFGSIDWLAALVYQQQQQRMWIVRGVLINGYSSPHCQPLCHRVTTSSLPSFVTCQCKAASFQWPGDFILFDYVEHCENACICMPSRNASSLSPSFLSLETPMSEKQAPSTQEIISIIGKWWKLARG